MGYVRIEYLIFEGNERLLKSFRNQVVKILSKEVGKRIKALIKVEED